MRRCSISARATGLTKMRCGSCNSSGSLRPSLPASSRAISVIATSAPAQGCSVRSCVVCADAAAGARLRQREREIGRAEERTRRLVVLGGVVLEREGRLRLDDAVVVLDLVVEPQRAARLPLRILDQRDRRRAVGDRGESPGEIAAADAAQRRRAVALDDEAALLGARRQRRARVGRRVLEAALARRHRSAHCRWRGSPAGCRPAPRPAPRRARFRPGAGPAASPAAGRYRPAA